MSKFVSGLYTAGDVFRPHSFYAIAKPGAEGYVSISRYTEFGKLPFKDKEISIADFEQFYSPAGRQALRLFDENACPAAKKEYERVITENELQKSGQTQKESDVEIVGIIFKHGENDYGLWEGFSFTKEEEAVLSKLFAEHDTDGCSIRGTKQEIADDFVGNYDYDK